MLPLPGMNQFHQGCKHVIRGHNCLDKQDDIQTPPSLQHHLSTRMLLVTHTLFMSITPTSVLPNTVVSQGHYTGPPTNSTSFIRPFRIVTIIGIDFQSCRNKTQELEHLISSVKPDVIIGTQTWLNSTINSNEIIKSALRFNVYRKDRPNKSYGGVFIAVTNNLISSVVTDLDTDCEILWVQIDLIGTKSLHIGSFSRPPNSDMTALDNQNLSLERLTHRTNGNIWLGGDFNAPHIDWSSMDVSPLAGGRRQEQQRLIDISLDHNIEQAIDKPTRGGNTWTYFSPTTNPPSKMLSPCRHLANRTTISYIYAEINIRPNRVCTPHRKVFVFRKADWDGIKRKLSALFEKMQENSEQPPVNKLWNNAA